MSKAVARVTRNTISGTRTDTWLPTNSPGARRREQGAGEPERAEHR